MAELGQADLDCVTKQHASHHESQENVTNTCCMYEPTLLKSDVCDVNSGIGIIFLTKKLLK